MAQQLPAGTEIAGYRIVSVIGRGGMGVVYLAEHKALERQVALKVLAPELSSDESFRARFQRESRLAASLDHPNVIPIYEAGEADGVLFIAMRYVAGPDLRALCHQVGQFEARRALGIVAQLASALDEAHSRGLIHRDVKPGNVLVAAVVGADGGEHVYLTDFGLTKLSSSNTGLTLVGQMVGTIDYISPEQIRGDPVDGRADIYALGCVLYELLAGQPPYVRDSDLAIMAAHLQEAPPRVTALRPDLPPGLDGVIATVLAKQPRDRYPTAWGMATAARAQLESVAVRAPDPGPGATVVLPRPAQDGADGGPQAPDPAARTVVASVPLPPSVIPIAAPPGPAQGEAPQPRTPAPANALAMSPAPGQAQPGTGWPGQVPPTGSSTYPPPPVPSARSRGPIIVGAAVIALLLVAGATWAALNASHPSPSPDQTTLPTNAAVALPSVSETRPSDSSPTLQLTLVPTIELTPSPAPATATATLTPTEAPTATPATTATPSASPTTPPEFAFDASLTPEDLAIARRLDSEFVDLASCRHYNKAYPLALSSFSCDAKRIPPADDVGGPPPDLIYYDSYATSSDPLQDFKALVDGAGIGSNPDCKAGVAGHETFTDTNDAVVGQYACYMASGDGHLIWTERHRHFIGTIVNGGDLGKLYKWFFGYPLTPN